MRIAAAGPIAVAGRVAADGCAERTADHSPEHAAFGSTATSAHLGAQDGPEGRADKGTVTLAIPALAEAVGLAGAVMGLTVGTVVAIVRLALIAVAILLAVVAVGLGRGGGGGQHQAGRGEGGGAESGLEGQTGEHRHHPG